VKRTLAARSGASADARAGEHARPRSHWRGAKFTTGRWTARPRRTRGLMPASAARHHNAQHVNPTTTATRCRAGLHASIRPATERRTRPREWADGACDLAIAVPHMRAGNRGADVARAHDRSPYRARCRRTCRGAGGPGDRERVPCTKSFVTSVRANVLDVYSVCRLSAENRLTRTAQSRVSLWSEDIPQR
jgi:hypothetical protein